MADQRQRGRLRDAGSPGEWVLGGISLLAVLAVAGLLVHHGLRREAEGPAVRVRAEAVRAADDSLWVVEFVAENTGGAPALDVRIEGRLGPPDRPVERAGATLELVPEGASRRGGLQFRHDPRRHALDLQATGWTRP